MPQLGLLNYGSGNYASVHNAFTHIGCDPVEVTSAAKMREVSHLVLPGVGSFPAAMDRLEEMRLVDELCEQILVRQKPFLGICVGMQILADTGFEFTERSGLGWVPGQVDVIEAAQHGLPTPHMGWNELTVSADCPLFAGIVEPASFYFVHSYQLQPAEPTNAMAHCEYGGPITACVQRDNVFGVQFHPEKSQRDGLRLLRNFCNL